MINKVNWQRILKAAVDVTDFGERSKLWKFRQQFVLTAAQAYYKMVSEQWERNRNAQVFHKYFITLSSKL